MGVILLTILFGGVVGYRMVRSAPTVISPVEVSGAGTPDVTSPNVPAPPASEPATAAVTSKPGSEVPPPPPVASSTSRRAAGRNSARTAPAAKIILVDPALAVEETPVPLTELKAAEAPKPEKLETAAVAAPVVKPDPTPPAQSTAANDAASKPEVHDKRIVKAFRRLLHIPKKEDQPETLKQP